VTEADETSELRQQLRAALAENEHLKAKVTVMGRALRSIASPLVHGAGLESVRAEAKQALNDAGEERWG
jgi:hypothetical protein